MVSKDLCALVLRTKVALVLKGLMETLEFTVYTVAVHFVDVYHAFGTI